jgi:hypothetical protein
MYFSFVLWKINFKIDRAGLVTLVIYYVSATLLAANTFLLENFVIFTSIVEYVRSLLVWFAIYYFTFEMHEIETTLEAGSYEEVEVRIKRTRIIKYAFIGTIVLVYGPLFTITLIV